MRRAREGGLTCFSLFSPLERQSPHWSPAATLRPEPLHLRHGCWTCCIMPCAAPAEPGRGHVSSNACGTQAMVVRAALAFCVCGVDGGF